MWGDGLEPLGDRIVRDRVAAADNDVPRNVFRAIRPTVTLHIGATRINRPRRIRDLAADKSFVARFACLPGGQPTNPLFFSNKNNGLQGQKTGSSIALNVLGGYGWPNAAQIEQDLLRKIVRAEIGEAAA